MPGLNLSITSGDQAQPASPAAIPCVVACCTAVSAGVYQFDAGQDVSATLGGALGAEAVYALLRQPGISRVVFSAAAQTWTAAPSVTQSGSGPAVSLALAGGASGCFDDHKIKITVKSGGTNGVAQIGIAYDGTTELDVLPVPVELPAVLRGTVDLAGLTLSTVNAKTLVFTAPASKTLTFGSTPTSVQDVADDFNTLAIAAPLAVRARVAETASGSYLELYSTAAGTTAGITLDATSTGDTVFGLSNSAVTGADATLSLPWTGLVATFPAGTYVAGETYTATCTGPRPSLSAEATARDAAVAVYSEKPFGFFAFVHPSTDATNCAARQAAHSTALTTLQASSSNPVPLYHVVGGHLHTASATLATNDTNIATHDGDVSTAFASAAKALDSVSLGDVYVAGASALRAGSYRRSSALMWAARRAGADKLADDVGSADLVEGSLLAPDGVTRARDEARASTKLGGGSGPGFAVLQATPGAGLKTPRFLPGATRAGPTSRLRYSGVVAVAKEIARLARPVIADWLAKVYPTDPTTKQLLDGEKTARGNEIKAAIDSTLLTADAGPLNVSARDVQILNPVTGTYLDNGIIRAKVPFVPLGEVEQVDLEVSATGTIIAG